ncbi:PepSY domain-containing protein [Streptomyces sp. DT18]
MKRKPVFAALAAAVVLAAGGGVAAASLGGDGGTSAASGTDTGATTHERAGLAGTGADDTAREDRDDDRDDRDSDDRDDDTRHGAGRDDAGRDDAGRDDAGRDDAARHDDTDDGQDDDARERAHDAAEHKAEAAAARKLAAPDALAAALAHTPGRALSAEIDDQDGRLVWEVEILDGSGKLRHVDVSPSSGKVLGAHTERGDADDVRAAKDLLTGDATSAAKAARAAAAKGTVVSIDLEEERNGYWSVETGPGEAEWSVALDGAKVTRGSDD